MEEINNGPFKVILVALDLSEMDDRLIRYAAVMSKMAPIERIIFVHVAKDLELPDDLRKKYPDLLAPLDESIESDIRGKVEGIFGPTDVDINYIIKEGNPIEKLLKLSKIKEVDLILMGRKKSLRGSGLVSSHIARKCPCSLLLVTEDFNEQISKILVPVDFSQHSLMATRQALGLATNADAQVVFSHAYHVPSGYHKTGKSHDEFAKIMKGHAENDCKRFLQRNELPADIECEYMLTNDGLTAELVYTYGKNAQADLIVMGSKGRTRTSAILMGSLAEKIVFKSADIPVLIVKSKGENMGFLEALLRV